MKIPTLSALLALALLLKEVTAQKTCSVATGKPCKKNENCVVPEYSLPGTKGVCGKKCNAGTINQCPAGSTCYVTSEEPGAEGTCVKDTMCIETKGYIQGYQDFLVEEIVFTYTDLLSSGFQDLLHQAVNPPAPAMCGGPDHMACMGEDEYCFRPPEFAGPDQIGHCFKNYEQFGICRSGTEDPCGEGFMCMTPPDTPMGGWGYCAPEGTKPCMTGMPKQCPKGYTCSPITYGPEVGTAGGCFEDDLCIPYHIILSDYEYWQVFQSVYAFYYGLSPARQAIVTKTINELAEEE